MSRVALVSSQSAVPANRILSAILPELDRLAAYDDESVVHDAWIRQRYDGGFAASYRPARTAAVVTAWHEAGHAVAALAVGARFSSASIRQGTGGQGRVHKIQGDGDRAFVVAAAGQIAERLRDWSLPDNDDRLRSWLATWRHDGGDALRFRKTLDRDEVAGWRYAEALLTPRRLQIRQVARALLMHPRYLRYDVVAAIARTIRETP
jgi:Peptidase M50B-like